MQVFSLASTIATCQISWAAFCRCASFGRSRANTHYRRLFSIIDSSAGVAQAFAQAVARRESEVSTRNHNKHHYQGGQSYPDHASSHPIAASLS
jgi:hypothetical protein